MEASKVVTELLLVQKATGVTDGLVGVVCKALLPEAHLDVPKASTLHWNL